MPNWVIRMSVFVIILFYWSRCSTPLYYLLAFGLFIQQNGGICGLLVCLTMIKQSRCSILLKALENITVHWRHLWNSTSNWSQFSQCQLHKVFKKCWSFWVISCKGCFQCLLLVTLVYLWSIYPPGQYLKILSIYQMRGITLLPHKYNCIVNTTVVNWGIWYPLHHKT